MKERVHQLTQSNVLICTFHSLGVRLLRETAHLLNYPRNFTIYDAQDAEKILKQCLEELELEPKAYLKTMHTLISSEKNGMLNRNQFQSSSNGHIYTHFQKVYEAYQAKLKECGAVDFDDLLRLPVQIFRDHSEVLVHYQERWSFLLIDEYQDTNSVQYQLVKFLVAKHNNLCVVGDPDQSIYSWRGAQVRNIMEFEQDFPGAKIIRLEQNYRSTANILDAANELISNNQTRYEKQLWSDKGPGEKIKIFTADTERDEASVLMEKISHHTKEHHLPFREIAVFYRTNAQSRVLEDKFLLHQIPYAIVGGISFYQRREIKDILAFLRMTLSSNDSLSFERTINLPKRGIGESTIEKMRQAASQQGLTLLGYCEALTSDQPIVHKVKLSAKQKESLRSYVDLIHALRRIAEACSLKELVKAAIEQSGYLLFLEEEKESLQERKENLNALISKAMEWELAAEIPTLTAFLEELSLKTTLDEAGESQSKDRVHLMTVHNGKGLEFDLVFLVGMEEDLFPHANSRDNPTAEEEERRLCYVGMTRAKRFLYLSNVRQRSLWGTTRTQRPSRFIYEIPTRFVERIHSPFQFHKKAMFTSKIVEETAHELVVPGDTVMHKDFGIGIVREVEKQSDSDIYKIFFSNDQKLRTLMAKFAHLKKI
jgi:DNA helicase-2/ATP-dependent DNA helicase PcrA